MNCEKQTKMENNENTETKTVTKKRKQKEVAVYGNYRNYYGYRIGQNLEEDPRLMFFKKEWFEDKDCLDIGCNQGLITISLAKKFCCRNIRGIDIDSGLIDNAYWNLRRIAKKESVTSQLPNAIVSEFSKKGNGLEHSATRSVNEEMANLQRDPAVLKERTLFDRVSFQTENFVESLHECREKYDTILCLSVTKWIHLNWGDDGLITLFVKIWRLLQPGGILLLEPQPWKSYQSNRTVSETTRLNYHSIVISPASFQDVLLDKIGFRTVENITATLPGSTAGFNRPILAFQK